MHAALEHYEPILDKTTDLPIALEKNKVEEEKDSRKAEGLREEQILALRQNLNNPGKVIAIVDAEGLPYADT